ncbi:MAG: efflux RND transporter periplasmic adaptor subunit [Alphaproteobacteria bacterium]|nr:efflux RND transporter periplasmic adaptor subunit [Alphaproteobacteria bacterium]MCL2505834.1 efflux RND transporter periplasmic adaptor subunit [Alphaproteobacteria bacterium]
MDTKKSYKKIIVISVIAVIAASGAYFWLTKGDDKNSFRNTVTVGIGNIEDAVTAQGSLEPKEYVDVGLQVSGQIQKIHVDVADTVEVGQLLVEIDPRIYQAAVEENRATLRSFNAQIVEQEASVALARKQFDRNYILYKSNAVSRNAFEQSAAVLKEAEARLVSLRAQRERAESALNAAETNLGFTKIYAPMAGVVAMLAVREGATLNAVQSSPTLLQLADLSVMTVKAQVAEADISNISLGMPARFTILGETERSWHGKVRLIQPTPSIENDVVLYDVLIDVNNEDKRLMNGMSAQVFFERGKAENVLILPREALGRRMRDSDNDKGRAYQVEVVIRNTTETRTITIGLTDRIKAEVTSGLTQGDIVAVPERVRLGTGGGGAGRMMGPRL